jgi:hypothetical protein
VPPNGVTGRTWADDASMEKAKKYGWNQVKDTFQSYVEIFDELKKSKVIPK